MKLNLLILGLIFFINNLFSGNPGNGFIENKGQIAEKNGKLHNEVNYKLELPGVNAYFKPEGIVYHFYKSESKNKSEYSQTDNENYKKGDFNAIGKKLYFFRLDFNLINANTLAKNIPSQIQDQKYNFYLSHCPKGITGVNSYEEITYENVYPNIDIKYYFKEGVLKYEFIVHPGGDINQIEFNYDGAKSITIDNGKLKVENDFNTIFEEKPSTYYYDTNEKIESKFTIKNKSISFNLNDYDHTKTIIIDPIITWASYYSNAYSSDFHCNSAFDSNGNIFTAYATYGSTWPTINAGSGQYYDAVLDGSTDLVIAKINSNLSKQWATYYGGNGSDYLCGTGGDYGKTIGVDATNNVYFGGYCSGATTFPTQASGTAGAFYQDQTKLYGGDNSFVVKLDNNGVRQWATLFQHEQANTLSAGMRLNGICVKGTKLYFTGETYKFNSNNIPLRTLAGAYNNSTFVGDQDPFIGRFDNNCILEWSTYFNGGVVAQKAYKQGVDLHVDASGNLIYVGQVSGTSPTSAYLINPGGGAYYSSVFAGSYDVQIAKFNLSMLPVWSTIYGSSDLDRVSEVASDASGNILIACRTIGGTGLPTANPGGAFYYATKQTPGTWTSPGSSDGGIMKFTPAGVLYWATYVGGTNNDWCNISGISSDNAGNIYATGYTNTTNFPTQNLAGSYYQAANGGGQDIVAMKFGSTGSLQWSTYYGGSGTDYNYGTKINTSTSSNGCGYKQFQSFGTSSAILPTVNPGAPAFFEGTKATANSNAVLMIEEPSSGGNSTAATSISPNPSSICSGSTATLTVVGGSLGSGASWHWYTGGCGTTAVGTGSTITVSPSSTTTYYVRAEGTCNTTACTTLALTVNPTPTVLFNSSVDTQGLCLGNSFVLPSGLGATTYTVFPGPLVGPGFTVTPTSNTTYSLVGTNASGCNSTNTATFSVFINPTATISLGSVSASTICSGANVVITPSGGSTYTLTPGSLTGSSFTVSPLITTTYTINGTNSFGCVSNTTTDLNTLITVNPTPTISLGSVSASTICSGANATITPIGASSYTLMPGSLTGTSFIVNPTTTTIYTISGTASNGCTSTLTSQVLTTTISVQSSFIVSSVSPSSSTICLGSSVVITPTGFGPVASFTLLPTGLSSTGSFTVSPTTTTTYTIRAVSTLGCVNTCSPGISVVNVIPTPTISLGSVSASTICSGANSIITPTGGSTYTLTPGSITGTSFTVSPTTTTTYTINGTNASGCVSNTSTDLNTLITVNPTPIVSAGPSRTLTCVTTNTTLSGSGGGTYSWTGPGIVSGGATSSPTINQPGTYSVLVTVSGCTNTANVVVSQNTVAPNGVNAGPNQTVTCGAPSVTLTGSYSSPAGCTANWIGGVSGSSTNFTTTASSAGIYTLVVTNPANGCSSSSTVQVSPSAGFPTATAASVTNSITCTNTLVPISITSTSTPISILWLGPSITGSSTTAATTVSAGGTYTVVVTNTLSLCSTSLTVIVPTNTLAVIGTSSIAPTTSLTCNVTSLVLNASPTGTMYAYNWTGPGIVSGASSASPTINIGGNYIVTITNTITGCSGTTGTRTITVPTNTTAPTGVSAGPNRTITCGAPSVTLTGSYTSPVGTTATWLGGVSGSSTSFTTTASSAGTFTLVGTNPATGCSSTSTVMVTPSAGFPSAIANAVTNSITCTNTLVPISITSTSTPISILWTGPSIIGSTTSASTTASAGGTYTVVVTNTVSLCSTSLTVIVPTNTTSPSVSISPSQSLTCGSPSVTISTTVSPSTDNTYSWSGPGILGGTASSSIGANAAGNYSVTVTNTLTGCTAIASTSVQSNSALPTLSVTSSSSVITCLAPTVTLTASSSSTSSIVWSASTGTLSNPVNAVVAGIYTVSITDGVSGCTNTQTISVSGTTVAPMPTVAASVAIPCGASSTTLLATSTLTSGVSYTWFGPSVSSGSNTANPTVDQMGTYTVVLTDTVTGCSSTSTVDVTQGNVVAAFSADQSTGFAPLTVNFTDASIGATSYNWSFGNGSTSSTQNPNTVYTNSGTYTVMLIASSGPCSDTAYATITVEDELYIPELFSPNGDNFNDKFEIKGIAKYPNNKITIYNRWGNKVYEKEKYNNDWDGKPNVTTGTGSNSLAAGTYYVVFDKGNDEKPYTGYVQIEY